MSRTLTIGGALRGLGRLNPQTNTMKAVYALIILSGLLFGCRENTSRENYGSSGDPDTAAEDWTPLFNGRDLEGWEIKFSGQQVGVNFRNTFRVEDGLLRVSYEDYDTFDGAYAHLYFERPYSYYKLRFDYRFTGDQVEGGEVWNVRNSGVMIHSQSASSNDFDQDFPVSVEVQLLGGLGAGPRHTANVCTPGTAVAMNGSVNYDHCIDSGSKTYDGDQWVHAEIVVLGGESITHIVENDTVLSYRDPQLTGYFINEGPDQPDWETFGITNKEQWVGQAGRILTQGYIALQAESHPIDFRNIELLDLCGCTDPKAANYKPYYVRADSTRCQYD